MAKLSDKLRKLKQKQRKPPARPAHTTRLRATISEERRAQRQHLAVLMAIEKVLVGACRQRPQLDDAVMEAAVRNVILGVQQPPESEAASGDMSHWQVAESLRELKQRSSYSDEVWLLCLRVVYQSILTHSSCTSGECRYLRFVAQFLPTTG